MLFPSIVFLFLFLPFTLAVYYLCLKNTQPRNIFLMVMSLVFYAWGEPFFVFLMIGSVIFNWYFAIAIDRAQRQQKDARMYLWGSLVLNIGILFCAKYLVFTLSNVNSFFAMNIYIPYIELPIGISFFTFQAMSYVIDVYWKRAEVQPSLMNVCLYIALFPQLVAGPIVRYTSIAEQIDHRKEKWEDVSAGTCRFIIGLAKKVFIADSMAVVADMAFGIAPANLTSSVAWVGAIAYTLQIYFDFSGYSDMAIGLGRMFGFTFPENFNYPYIAKSITDFWRRWHMSLSAWFRDYLYIPLGGNRVSKPRFIFNIFFVWSCTGIWHGANWTFFLWGFFFAVFLSFEKLLNLENRAFFKYIAHPYTMFLVIISWVIFRSPDFTYMVGYLKAFFAFDFLTPCDCTRYIFQRYSIYFVIAILAALPFYPYVRRFFERPNLFCVLLNTMFHMLLLWWVLSLIVKNTYSPFIYFNF